MDALTEHGELYRDEAGHEVWRIRNRTGHVVAEGIASDHDARWLADQVAAEFDPTTFDPAVTDIRTLTDRQLRDVSSAHPDSDVSVAARRERIRRSDEPHHVTEFV